MEEHAFFIVLWKKFKNEIVYCTIKLPLYALPKENIKMPCMQEENNETFNRIVCCKTNQSNCIYSITYKVIKNDSKDELPTGVFSQRSAVLCV